MRVGGQRVHGRYWVLLLALTACGGSESNPPDAAVPTGCVLSSDCDDGTLCTSDVCNDGVCQNFAINEGEECSEDPCHESSTCEAGQCVVVAKDCSFLSDMCNEASCDSATGECVATPVSDGTTCDDGLFCTDADSCQAGVCGGAARDCSSADDDCNVGVCDEAADACVPDPANEGDNCDDGEFCTVQDTCTSGVCGGSPRDCSSATDQCNTGICDEAADACVGDPIADGTLCNDDLFCSTGDRCVTGACMPTGSVDCSNLDGQCRVGVCDETDDQCVGQPTNEGTACNDGQFCTTGETCQSGTCLGTTPTDCADTDSCTSDSCDEAADECINSPIAPIPNAEGPPGNATCTDGIDNDCDGASDLTDPDCIGCIGDADCDDGNECTDDVCNAVLVCDNTPLTDTPCSDGLFCTDGDICSAGTCIAQPRDCSNLDDQCNVGVCSESLDSCVASATNEGNSCDDGLFCKTGETCQSGVCTGADRDCSSAGDQCNVGVCDETDDQCVPQAANEGGSCSDGLFCSTGDSCVTGACMPTGTLDCSSFDGQCRIGTCDEGNDQCFGQAINEGGSCDDGLFCNSGETCQSGVCTGGGPTDCADTDVCTADSCDEGGDACVNNNVPVPGAEGPPGDATCTDGLDNDCDGNTDLTDPNCIGCTNSNDCDDGNDCTDDVCNALLVCENNALTGTPCSDGLFCTDGDICSAGTCTSSPRDCSSLDDQCNVGVCSESLDSCVASAINEGNSCNDGLFCKTNETCQSGACIGQDTDCSSAGDQCNIGVCDEGNDQCIPQAANEGDPCDDTLFCSTGDRCVTGACLPTGSFDCSNLDGQCNVGVCDEGNDQCVPQAANEGDPCDDNQFCNSGETCQSGLCTGGGPTDCADTDVCTTDSCDEGANQCLNDPVAPIPGAEGPPGGATCTDGIDNDCDGDLDLADPDCVGCTVDGDCDDGNDCTDDSCSAQLACENTPLSGTPCNDGLFCTDPDTCTAGVCLPQPRDCSSLDDQCNNGTCSESQGQCVQTPANEGANCNDGLFCETGETCQSGTCQGVPRDCSAFTDPCHTGVCDEQGSTCFADPFPDGASCDVGFCTDGETCLAGNCIGGTPKSCGDGDSCTTDTCDELGDQCLNSGLLIDPDSLVATSSDDILPLDVCLTAGSNAQVVVWTELRDTQGLPISGATVTIGGVSATESVNEAGTYFAELFAAGTPSTTTATVQASACGDSTTLSTTVAIDNAPANATAGGTGGCSPVGGNLRVRVIEAETGNPISGAPVLIGLSEQSVLEQSAESLFGGASSLASTALTTDLSGYIEVYDYGSSLDGPVTVTAGATDRAYMTIADGDAADLVLALPLLHPVVASTTVYDNGTGTVGGGTGCGPVDAAIVLPTFGIDFLSQFQPDALFEPQQCWVSNNGNIGTVAVPSNLWVPDQSVGPFCLGGSVDENPWVLTLKNTADTGVTEDIVMVTGRADVFDVQDILNAGGGLVDLLPILNYHRIGWELDENVPTDPTSGRSINANDNFPSSFVVNYQNRPVETDIVGATAGDYDGTNGIGPLMFTGTGVHEFDVSGSSVSLPVSDFNASGAPMGVRRLAAISALYNDPADHPSIAPNRLTGISSVLIRDDGAGGAPFDGSGGSATVNDFLDISGQTFSGPDQFEWDNAQGTSGNQPQYSVHELVVRTQNYLPVLSCDTTNEVRDEFSVQWIVVRPYLVTCSGAECFTLPTLPASFPRSGSGVQQKSGFEQLLGSGSACSQPSDCSLTGETCVDPDAGGPEVSMCMVGSGSLADPYQTQDYRWHMHLYDLELLLGFQFNDFEFLDRTLFMTHESSNRADFD